MSMEMNDPKTLLTGALAALSAALSWIWVRVVGQQDRHESRLMEIEKTMASKEDITQVYGEITAMRNQSRIQHEDLATRMNDQHAKILTTLLERSGR